MSHKSAITGCQTLGVILATMSFAAAQQLPDAEVTAILPVVSSATPAAASNTKKPQEAKTTGSVSTEAATQPTATTSDLQKIQVIGSVLGLDQVGTLMPDVEEGKIFAGKKTSNIVLQESAKMTAGNYRKVLEQTPGLVLSEETSPLVSIGYRGFEPHRMQYFQVLENGIPIHADMLGYPEAYYTPAIESVESLELSRGGSALMYGPQPAGALNYRTKLPQFRKSSSGSVRATVGSNGYFSSFAEYQQGFGNSGFNAFALRRQGDGYRYDNSDFSVDSFQAGIVHKPADNQRLYLWTTWYDERHGEPGGLSRKDFHNNPEKVTRKYDEFSLERYALNALHEVEINSESMLATRAWFSYYSRNSWRQRGGGFGTVPSGPAAKTNSIEHQEFYNFGLEPRYTRDWEMQGNTNTFTAGMTLYYNFSPRKDERGNSPWANSGVLRNSSERETTYVAAFAENKFSFGKLSLIPGIRLENYWMNVTEFKNTDKTNAGKRLADESQFSFVPLFGLGAQYDFNKDLQAYANISQAYRPAVFTQAVPTSPNQFVLDNLDASEILTYEIGMRGNLGANVKWDSSLFMVDFSNQIGSVTDPLNPNLSYITNSGRSRTLGWDLYVRTDLYGLTTGKSSSDSNFSLDWINGLTLMHGEFRSGINEGNTPQYTPDVVYRSSLEAGYKRLKASLAATYNASSYADNNNTSTRYIPSYVVWDLTVDYTIIENKLSATAGINNLFDNNYFSRVRSDGIDPAAPRNYFVGMKYSF